MGDSIDIVLKQDDSNAIRKRIIDGKYKNIPLLIYKAIIYRSYECLSTILEIKPDFKNGFMQTEYDLVSFLHLSIDRNDLYATQLLFAFGYTPLICQKKCPNNECVTLLEYSFRNLSNNSPKDSIVKVVWATTFNFFSGLLSAVKMNDLQVLERILNQDLNEFCSLSRYLGRTPKPLKFLSIKEQLYPPILNSQNFEETSSSWGALSKLFSYAGVKATKAFSDWLTPGTSSEENSELQSNPLFEAAKGKLPENIQVALDFVKYRAIEILYVAATMGHLDAVKHLSKFGFTCGRVLTKKVSNENCGLVNLQVIKQGFDSTSELSETGYFNPIRKCYKNKLFVENNFNDHLLQQCRQLENTISDRIFNKLGVFLSQKLTATGTNLVGSESDTPLHAAIRNYHIDIVEYLIENQPSSCKISSDINQNSVILPIHTACSHGSVDSLNLLLNAKTVLKKELSFELEEFSCYLSDGSKGNYKHLFNIDQTEEHGLTPLMLAILNDNEECVNCLLNYHVNSFNLDDDDQSLIENINLGGGLESFPEESFDSMDKNIDEISEDVRPKDLEIAQDACFYNENETISDSDSSFNYKFVPINMASRVFAKWMTSCFNLKNRYCQITIRPFYHNEDADGDYCGSFSVLHLAIIQCNLNMVNEILKHCKPEMINLPIGPCLHSNEEEVPFEKIENLLYSKFHGINNDEIGQYSLEIIRLLLSYGAKDYQNILLLSAIERNDFHLASCLLSNGSSQRKEHQDGLVIDWTRSYIQIFLSNLARRQKFSEVSLHTAISEACWFGEIRRILKETLGHLEENMLVKPVDCNDYLDNLTEMHLKKCQLTSCPISIFTFLPNIKLLDLSNNKIRQLPDNLPIDSITSLSNRATIWCPSLTMLNLSYNQLRKLPPWLFDNSLANMNATGSSFHERRAPSAVNRQNINQRVFRFAPNLDTLNLSNNKIDELPQQMWFNRSISSLDVGNNYLTCLPKITMSQLVKNNSSFKRRRSRSTSENMIVAITNLMNCHDSFEGIQNQSDLLPCPKGSLKQIIGPDTFVSKEETTETMSTFSRQPFSGLNHLFINNNQISCLPLESQLNVHSVNRHLQNPLNRLTSQMPTNELDQIVPGLRTLAPNLITLIANNNKIVHFGFPHDYPMNLTIVDLSHNSIDKIGRDKAMDDVESGGILGNLHTLNLSSNDIRIFEPINIPKALDTISKPPRPVCGMSSKDSKTLHTNSIISKLWFPKITMLDLSGNERLHKISSSVVYCSNLNFVDLSGCFALDDLPSELWRLEHLKVLNINKTSLWKQMQCITEMSNQDYGTINTKAIISYMRGACNKSKAWSSLRLNILGPPKCGKSVLVKGLLAQNNQKKRSHKVYEDENLLKVYNLSINRMSPINLQEVSKNPASSKLSKSLAEISAWTEEIDFSVWDFATPHDNKEVSSVSLALQRYAFTKGSITLLLWNMSEGIEALEKLHIWMVDLHVSPFIYFPLFVKCRQPNSLIVIIGTHGDKLKTWSSIEEAQEAVSRRYTSIGPDSASFGIQPIFAQFTLKATHSDGSASSSQYKELASLIHRAGNSLKLTGRSTAMLLGHSGISSLPKRLVGLPIPNSYHILSQVLVASKLTLFNEGKFPILSVNNVIDRTIEMIFAEEKSIGSKYQLYDELKYGLRFLHEVGQILYFSHPNYSRFVVLDNIFLVNYLAKFLLSYSIAKEDIMGIDAPSKRLPNKAGVFLLKSLEEILSLEKFDANINSKDVLDYFQGILGKFEVAVPLDKEHLIVPSLLPEVNIFSCDDTSSIGSCDNIQPMSQQIRVKNTLEEEAEEDQFDQSDSSLSCSVYSVKKVPGAQSTPIKVASEPFDRFHPGRQAVKKNPQLKWSTTSEPEDHLSRIYLMSYIPSGFWTRLITRILTDTSLDLLCSHLYDLESLSENLKESLLPSQQKNYSQNPIFQEYSYSATRIRRKPTHLKDDYKKLFRNHLDKDRENQRLIPGWSVSKSSLRLTLGSGAIKVLSIEQTTDSCSASVLLARLMEKEKFKDLPTDTIPDAYVDYRKRTGRLIRYDAKNDTFKTTSYNGFQTLCIIELFLYNETIIWPEYQSDNDLINGDNTYSLLSLKPNPQILAQIFTKILEHVDNLLEDWYPDLGSQFQQTTEGHYLINRIIPCTQCMANVVVEMEEPQTESQDEQALCRTPDGKFKLESAVELMMNFYDLNDENMNQNDVIVKDPDYTSCLYFLTIEEYLHAYFIKSKGLGLESFVITCPYHKNSRLKAPDLLFEDLGTLLSIERDRVRLDTFLGRGSFGTVFKGLFNQTNDEISDLSSSSGGNLQIPVAIKVSTPIDPNVINRQPFMDDASLIRDIDGNDLQHHQETLRQQPVKKPDQILTTSSISSDNRSSEATFQVLQDDNIREAIMFYQQQLRKWHLSSVESCYQAYQELRIELNVFYRITHWNLPEVITTKSVQERPQIMNEILRPHPHNLLIFLGIVKPKPLAIIIPLAPKGSLSSWLYSVSKEVSNSQDLFHPRYHPLHPITITFILYQLADALNFLHGLRIVHRDIKSDNVLLWQMPEPMFPNTPSNLNDPRNVKLMLADFGISRPRASLDGCRGYVGTPGYMAPEILEYLGEETYIEKVDIYSLGILFCELISLKNPYELGGENNPSMKFNFSQNIINGGRPKIRLNKIITTPCALIKIMESCWQSDPGKRPSASRILSALSKSSWLTSALSLRENIYQLSYPARRNSMSGSLKRSSLLLSGSFIINSSGNATLKRTHTIRNSLRKSRDITHPQTASLGLPSKSVFIQEDDAKFNSAFNVIDNSFSKIRKVDHIRILDVVTCATIDCRNRVWLGGYQIISGMKDDDGPRDSCACSLAGPKKALTPDDISMPAMNLKPGCYGRHGLVFVMTLKSDLTVSAFTSPVKKFPDNSNATTTTTGNNFNNKQYDSYDENCFLITSWCNPIGVDFSPFPKTTPLATTTTTNADNTDDQDDQDPFGKEGWPLLLNTYSPIHESNPLQSSSILWCSDSNNWIHAYDKLKFYSFNYQNECSLETMCRLTSVHYTFSDPTSEINCFSILHADVNSTICLVFGTSRECGFLRLSGLTPSSSGQVFEESCDLKLYPCDLKTDTIVQCSLPMNNRNLMRNIWVGQGKGIIQVLRWSGFLINGTTTTTQSSNTLGATLKPRLIEVDKRVLRSNNPNISYVTQLCCDDDPEDCRIWSYQYPENSISCWSANSKQPMRHLNLDNLINQIPNKLRDNITGIKRVDNLIWANNRRENFDLYASTTNGLLVSIKWPGNYSTSGPSAIVGDNSQIRCQITSIHEPTMGPRNFHLLQSLPTTIRQQSSSSSSFYYWPNLGQLISIGFGLNDDFNCLLNSSLNEDEKQPNNNTKYTLVHLFDDQFYNDWL